MRGVDGANSNARQECNYVIFSVDWQGIWLNCSRSSSVGRASDWRSEGLWFDPGLWQHFFLSLHVYSLTRERPPFFYHFLLFFNYVLFFIFYPIYNTFPTCILVVHLAFMQHSLAYIIFSLRRRQQYLLFFHYVLFFIFFPIYNTFPACMLVVPCIPAASPRIHHFFRFIVGNNISWFITLVYGLFRELLVHQFLSLLFQHRFFSWGVS